MRSAICALLMAAWASGAAAGSPFPLQLEARAPYEPTAFPSAGRQYLAYELYLTNVSASPMTLSRIEVLDADGDPARPAAVLEGDELDTALQPFGPSSPRQLAAGATTAVFMWLPFDAAARVPARLRHRVTTTDGAIEGALVDAHHSELRVLAPMVEGAGWTASDGPSNARSNHHRRGVLALNGRLVISRRFAIDWMKYKDGGSIAYGEPVFAVADATVVKVKDGQPDNTPAPVASFHPALPITLDNAGGNMVVLDLGGGQYAWYFHLRPGSLRVKAGDHVRRGEPLAQIGVSGDSNMPHLHFELTTSPTLLEGEGLPYLIDRYRILTKDKGWETRTRELPLDGMLVDFGKSDGN